MIRLRRLGVGLFALLSGMAVTGAETACLQSPPLSLRIRMAGDEPRQALLRGGTGPGLSLLDAVSEVELWSAGSESGATQTFAEMTAAFGHSLTALDLDGDGIHDRLYAGDHAGRLWRFDLHAGAAPRLWVSGGVLASLGSPGVARGFVAAPDVALIAADGDIGLRIAIGTATVGEGIAANRFYVLRDPASFEQWDAARYARQPALTESDLAMRGGLSTAPELAGPGYFMPLGSSQVMTRSLTLGGQIHFTVAETSSVLFAGCPAGTLPSVPSILSISIIRATDGALTQDLNEDGRVDRNDHRVSLPHRHSSLEGFELDPATAGAAATLTFCSIAGQRVAQCSLDTTPQRTYWRREDAD